jgi:phosphatidylserine/phosphatidylglycerophosphate/cardiolipin synthase-like enzyme
MFVRTLGLMLATIALVAPTSVPASATPDNFTPRQGPTFNSAVGDQKAQKAIFRKIIRSVNSTPRGADINMFTWNFLTREGKEALLRAQRRGVRVRLLMDDQNLTVGEGGATNSPFRKLRRGLRRGNRGVPLKRRSWARVCEKTCRGGGGAAHSKFFTFSRVGKARKVVMQGSANFTVASGSNQWNDVYTHKGHDGVWRFATRTFNEAARDRRMRKPYASKSFKGFRLMMFPNTGRVTDPVMQMLNKISCRGARNTRNGRTRVMITPDVIRSERGMALAKRIRYLHNHGCNIKVGYTVMGIKHGRMLRAAGVPMRHLVQDYNNDGQFDNYFHMKSMSVVGRYGRDRSAHVVLNGSANWSGLAKVSDENLGIYRSPRLVRRYEEHMNYWYRWFGTHARSLRLNTSARMAIEPGRLIFGSGPDAVYEDGEPVSTDGTNPFATMPMD